MPHTHLIIDLDILPDQLDFRVRVLDECGETLLDGLDLLRDGTEDTLLETIELVEASPRADLTETDEDTTHCLEVERLVTAEDQDEATELNTEGLDRLRLTCDGCQQRGLTERTMNVPVPAGPKGEPPN